MSALAVFLTASLAQNVILIHFFGVWPFGPAVYSPRRAAVVSGVVTIALVWVTAVYALVRGVVLTRWDLVYLETITVVLILLATVVSVVRLGTRFAPYYRGLILRGTPFVVINTTVFVVATSVPRVAENATSVLLAALGAGVGLFVALVPIAAIRRHLDRSRLPRALRGDVSVYLATAFTALAIQQIDRIFLSFLEPLW